MPASSPAAAPAPLSYFVRGERGKEQEGGRRGGGNRELRLIFERGKGDGGRQQPATGKSQQGSMLVRSVAHASPGRPKEQDIKFSQKGAPARSPDISSPWLIRRWPVHYLASAGAARPRFRSFLPHARFACHRNVSQFARYRCRPNERPELLSIDARRLRLWLRRATRRLSPHVSMTRLARTRTGAPVDLIGGLP